MPQGAIRIEELAQRRPGFPFGLILEHSFVHIDEHTVFQKADPKPSSAIELLAAAKALEPYTGLNGYELTRHAPGNV